MKRFHRAFLHRIAKAKSVLIGTHKNPDGDALGCALALARYLDHRKIPCEIVCHNPPPANLRFLPQISRIRMQPEREDHDVGIVLDLDSIDRLGDTAPAFHKCPTIIVMDHHVPHEAPGDLRIVDTTAPATAVILTRLLNDIRAEIDPQMATCLLTGIITDTGGFRFRNTTPEALHLAAKLLESGGEIALINHYVFDSKPVSNLRLLGIMLAKMQLDLDDRLAYAVLERKDFEMTGATDEDTEGFVNHLLSIESVECASLLREHTPNKWRASLRSKGCLDVASVAQDLGGGGHRNAAGCSFEGTEDDALSKLLPALKTCLESS